MASAQVLPNSAVSARKQEHLEAGKRRLEEFRKKKAADRAKKPSSASQLHSANVEEHEKQPLDNQIVRLTNSDGAGTSDGVYETIVEPSHVVINEESSRIDFVQNNDLDAHETNANPPVSINYHNEISADKLREPAEDKEFDRYNSLLPQEKNDDFSISTSASGSHAYGIATDHSVASRPQVVWQTDGNSNHHSPYGLEQAHSKDSNSHVKNVTVMSPVTSHAIHTPINSTDFSFEVGKSIHAVPESNNSSTFDIGQKFSNSVGRFPSGSSIQLWPSESQYTALSSDLRSSSSDVPFYPAVAESNSRRSRPSFLDSINIARVPHTEPKRVELFSSKLHETDGVPSSAFEKSFTEPETIQPLSNLRAPTVPSVFEHSMNSSVSAGNGDDLYRHTVNESMEKHDSYSRKQDEDFSALEQHIEDLTQEKFSLQRALEASRALAESLATENSSLTESYNQQGSAVNQLKSDMENLQGEVKAHLVELHSLKMECANAQLECNAADERAKLLASEVIGLEEKALRLRSSELKLERQLERSQAEVSSLKKKISSIEKDRQDLQSTIDALQEEKKLLQAKLRKASANGKFTDVSKSLSGKKDVSTSTGDLIHEDDTYGTTGSSNLEMYGTAPLLGSDASSSSLLPENRQLNLEVSSLDIPPDQMRMIQNIHTLISELKLEKQELMQAALAQSSECSHLKELNKELSRKFEAQTQRLELLTAQNMATENISARPEDPRSIQENTPYADEGDEVVERVLGWIMKLFPGGPSRRRTNKLL